MATTAVSMSSLRAVSAVRGDGRRVGVIVGGRYSTASRALAHRRASPVVRVAADMGPEMKASMDKFLGENKVVCFIKGTKDAPKCGFSNTVVQIFNSVGVPYETVNILEDEGLRAGMKVYSAWPTFPQVYVDGEFYGGCDICIGAPHPRPTHPSPLLLFFFLLPIKCHLSFFFVILFFLPSFRFVFCGYKLHKKVTRVLLRTLLTTSLPSLMSADGYKDGTLKEAVDVAMMS
jgi:monothiol glutaredoxin